MIHSFGLKQRRVFSLSRVHTKCYWLNLPALSLRLLLLGVLSHGFGPLSGQLRYHPKLNYLYGKLVRIFFLLRPSCLTRVFLILFRANGAWRSLKLVPTFCGAVNLLRGCGFVLWIQQHRSDLMWAKLLRSLLVCVFLFQNSNSRNLFYHGLGIMEC